MLRKIVLTSLTLCVLSNWCYADSDKVICYYKSWHDDIFPPDKVNLDVCTHVNFAFLRLNDDGSFRFDEFGGNETVLIKFGALKEKNPNIKLLITVGGYTDDALTFSRVAQDDHKKANLASNLITYMQNYNLDGIDIDWLYPSKNGGIPEDKENLLDMLSVIRRNLDNNGGGLITFAVSANPDPDSYNINALSQLVDSINILTYDFHGFRNDTETGENAPLYPSPDDSDWNKNYGNCDAAINNWLNNGVDPAKLVMALAFYGHVFELVDPDQHNIGAPANGADEDYIAYNELCQLTDGWTEEFNDDQKVPYKYNGTQWIGYDNSDSIALKMKYVKERRLSGVVIWSVNDDDTEGICGEANPLLKAISNNLYQSHNLNSIL